MASGDTLARFTPLGYEPHSSSPATLDTRNQHPVIDFDATNNEYCQFSDVMPRHYGGGGTTACLHVAFSSATSGSAVFSLAWERIGVTQDMDSDSFATAACVTFGAAATAGIPVACPITFTDGANMDSVAVGEGYRVQVRRNPSDAEDNASGDAEVRFLEIRET